LEPGLGRGFGAQRWQSGSFDARPQSAADCKMLVVDDSMPMRRVTELLLTHAGWRAVLDLVRSYCTPASAAAI